MASESKEFAGTALVSAGASGIGRTIAETFLAGGAAVHVCDASAPNIERFLHDNSDATASLADVSDPSQVDQVYAEFSALYDRLDVLVNNAGIAGPMATVDDVSIDEWNRCLEVDLNSAFYMTRSAVPLMRRAGGGSIVNMSSTAGLLGCPLRSPYVAAKWALIGLTKTWAMELGPDGIRVNAVCPGSVSGERIDAVIAVDAERRGVSEQHVRDAYLRQSSLRTFASAEDIANMIVFLSSDQGARISGQSIAIDGHTESLANWSDQQSV